VTRTAPSPRTLDVEHVAPNALGIDRAFVESWLMPGVDWGLTAEHPRLFAPSGHAQSIVLRQANRLLGHAALLEVRVRTTSGMVPTTLIGSVVIAPEHRGQGLGRRLLAEVCSTLDRSPSKIAILWSDKPGFYRRAGFEPSGSELVVRIATGQPNALVRRAHQRDVPSLLALHAAKPNRVLRTLAEFAALLAIPRTQTWVLDDVGIRAYACVGKGMDFGDVMHECGGDDASLLQLLPALPTHLAVLAPWRRALARRLGSVAEGPLGLVRTGKPLPDGFYIDGLDSI